MKGRDQPHWATIGAVLIQSSTPTGPALDVPAAHLVSTAESAYPSVRRLFVREHPQLEERLGDLCLSWPNLQPILARTSFFLSPGFPTAHVRSQSAMVRAMRNGVVAGLPRPAVACFGDFIRSFMTTLGEILASTRVFGYRGDGTPPQMWNLFDAPLSLWAASFDYIGFDPAIPADAEMQACIVLLAGRTLDVPDMALLLANDHPDQFQWPLFSEPVLR